MDDNQQDQFDHATATDVSRETDGPSVSRETAPSGLVASLGGMRTAAEIAAGAALVEDTETPLARAAEHSVLARQSVLNRPAIARPAAPRIFVVANQKGGVGKTTSTVNLAAGLAQLGQRVLVIDLDPQGNASTALGVPHPVGTPGTYEVIVDATPIDDVAVPCPDVEGVDVVPATIDLAGAEIELVPAVAREFRLKNALAASKRTNIDNEDRWDFVFIDCPPSLGLLTINALTAGTEVLIPIQAEYYALEGLAQLLNTVELARKALNPVIAVTSMLITMYDARTRLASGVAEQVRDSFGDIVLNTYIPRSVRVSEAPSYGESVMTYDPGSPGALSYLEAARELALKGSH